MRKTLFVLAVVALLGLSRPADAQLRSAVSSDQAPVKIYGQNDTGFSLDDLFQPGNFKMQHAASFSSGSFGGGFAYGMYTNTVLWQPSQKVAARMDVSYLQDFGGTLGMDSRLGAGGQEGQLFIRNAEMAYRPTENMQFHFQIRQSPFGQYAQPFGRSAYGGYGGMHASSLSNLFWRTPGDAR